MVRASRLLTTGWTQEAHAQADQLAGSRPVLWSISMGQPPRLAQSKDQADPSGGNPSGLATEEALFPNGRH
jgi:hypothetical protein